MHEQQKSLVHEQQESLYTTAGTPNARQQEPRPRDGPVGMRLPHTPRREPPDNREGAASHNHKGIAGEG